MTLTGGMAGRSSSYRTKVGHFLLSRLISSDGNQVTFRWRDYAHGNKKRKMTLSAEEFIRRFLLHVLPQGLVRIRHFGFMANHQRGILMTNRHVANALQQPPPTCAMAIIFPEVEPGQNERAQRAHTHGKFGIRERDWPGLVA